MRASRAQSPEGRRPRSRGSELSAEEEGVFRILARLAKPVANLTDMKKRDDPVMMERNMAHLGKLTRDTVRSAMDQEVLSRLDEVTYRLKKLEDDGKVTYKAAVEKADGLKVNEFYPEHDIEEAIFVKAVVALAAAVKIIERSITFPNSPWGFIYFCALESNKLARNFQLSRRQQLQLLLTYIPPSPQADLLSVPNLTLKECFGIISIYTDKSSTRDELEKKIYEWSLGNRTQEEMYASVTELLSLLKKVEPTLTPPNLF
jgi:hypothetical protein